MTAPLPNAAASHADDVLDHLLVLPQRIAAAIVAQDTPEPALVVDVGAYQGEFLEAFLDRFPGAQGQWTDAGDSTLPDAQERLGRFGDRVSYVIGAPSRDVTDPKVPAGMDVLTTSWVTSHRGPARMAEFYAQAYEKLAPGGWLVNLDHVTPHDDAWARRVEGGRLEFREPKAGPPMHHDERIITLAEHVSAITAAGFTDFDVVFRSFDAAMFVARK